MTMFKMKPYVRMVINGTAESHSLTLLKTRDLIDVSDEPAERGGTNEGMAPTEFFLSSLAACTNVISHKICKKNDIDLQSMEITVDAGFNRLGVKLEEDVELPFPDIKLRIEITSSANDEQLEILKTDLPKYCAISKMIAQAGTVIDTDWVVNRP